MPRINLADFPERAPDAIDIENLKFPIIPQSQAAFYGQDVMMKQEQNLHTMKHSVHALKIAREQYQEALQEAHKKEAFNAHKRVRAKTWASKLTADGAMATKARRAGLSAEEQEYLVETILLYHTKHGQGNGLRLQQGGHHGDPYRDVFINTMLLDIEAGTTFAIEADKAALFTFENISVCYHPAAKEYGRMQVN
ncbi:hypothetical protein BJ508DRAFT_311746 [Ascobolus immersus RN42]|uniref:Uncharacterized protein n=1 Tax=Ascobolus immersus RN42 TaxID=1160509 RepID=A0A3N4HTA5_ASCIM|nr:hypothetical protein BJ508DRAFT_311746 [Ascobolus immersus RN42]